MLVSTVFWASHRVRAHADWHEACFIPDLTDAEAAWAVPGGLRVADDDLVSGLALRRFEPLTGAVRRSFHEQ